jgi:hypothetical protein
MNVTVSSSTEANGYTETPSDSTTASTVSSSSQLDAVAHSISSSLAGIGAHLETELLIPLQNMASDLIPSFGQFAATIGGALGNTDLLRSLTLTPAGGASSALPIFHYDGVCAGWRAKQTSWQVANRPLNSCHLGGIRHAITV